MSVFPGPQPPYTNVPINANFYLPNQFFISAVSLGVTTTVTTTVNHNYVIGQLVRLIIPEGFGCVQLNGQAGYVISIPAANEIQLNIDSSQNVDPFVAASLNTQPQTLATGDVNNGTVNSQGLFDVGTFIPGSFIDISPV